MASRPNECDRNRLRLSLEDRLSEALQAELADHLEGCASCRQELEQMAAASKFWGAAALVRGEPAPGAALTVGLGAEGGPQVLDEDGVGDVDAGWREFLDPPDPEHTDTLGRLGPYEILEVLGRGGMGVVLKARDPALNRTVAIKLLTPAFSHGATARRRFAREARAVAAVGHEHIVAIHAVDEFRGLPYLVMQYVPGRSLQERIDATGPLEVREILRIGTQAARALAAAHAQGVVHRDIMPANILLENCIERVKLTDFGLARVIDDASLTLSGVIAGTQQYMAPEQARGESVDARADLFALGGALYAMAAGRSPFRADSTMAVLKRVCEVRHRPIREINPDVPDWLEATIDRLLAKEPADRFQTATEVADLLEKGLAHLQQPTIVPPPVVPGIAAKAGSGLDLDPDLDPRAIMPLRRARRRLPLVASLFLLSVAGLGASEAAGLTQVADFVATILRIKTPDGTMVIKVDEPNVKVQIDGDTVVIGGAGPQEIRLPVGRHRVQAIKDGKAVRDQLVTIARGGKEIVNVDFVPTEEGLAAATALPSRTDPLEKPPSGGPKIASHAEARPDVPGLGIVYADLNNDGLIDVSVVDSMPTGRFFLPDGMPAGPTSSQNKSAATTADYSRTANRSQTDNYEKQLEKIREMIEGKKGELKDLVRKGRVKFNPTEKLNIKNEGDATQPTFKSPPEDHLQRLITETYQTELELFDANALLEAKLDANRASQGANEQRGGESDRDLLARIQTEFRNDPEVAGLVDEIENIRDHIDQNKRVERNTNDPSRQAAVNHLQKLSERYDLLWRHKYEEIRQRLRVASGTVLSPASIEELKLKIRLLNARLDRQTTLLKEMEFKQKGSNEDTFEYTYLNYELNNLLHWEEQVRKNLEQLKYEAAHEKYRVSGSEADSAAKVPSSSKALRDMAAAPVGIRTNPDRARAIVWSLAFSPDGSRLAIGQQAIDRPPSILRIWDLAQHRDTYRCQQPVGYRTVAFSSDGRNLAAGNFDGTLTTFAIADQWEFQLSENQGSPINSLAFLPNSKIISAGDWDGWVRFHGPDTMANRSRT
jgi:serine/threonine protein kinase